MKVDSLNKRELKGYDEKDFKRMWEAINKDEEEGAKNVWNAFITISNTLAEAEDKGVEIIEAVKAMSALRRGEYEPVNRRLVAEWLEAGKFDYKGLNDIK